jgi:hypothetical protein
MKSWIVLTLAIPLAACVADEARPDTDDRPVYDTGAADTGSAADTGTVSDVPVDDTPATAADCNIDGRWLVSQRTLAAALGQTQAAHNWFYYEIKQDGEDLTVTKGLHCGYVVQHVSTLGANVSSEGAWPGILAHLNSDGRKGHMKPSGSQCAFDLAREYAIRGATVTYYRDPKTTLPTLAQQASGSTPGWEDWDADGKPGITLSVSGPAAGKLYLMQRDWTEYSGNTAKKSDKFQVPITWNTEQSVLGRDGSALIEQPAVPDSDPAQAWVWFHRLDASQATGSDTEICEAIRTLKDTLVPEGNK